MADLAELHRRIDEVLDARDWHRHHTPKNLVVALTGEVGELVEVLRWLTPEEADRAGADPELRARLEDELADVLIGLTSLAKVLDVALTKVPATSAPTVIRPSGRAAPAALKEPPPCPRVPLEGGREVAFKPPPRRKREREVRGVLRRWALLTHPAFTGATRAEAGVPATGVRGRPYRTPGGSTGS